MAYRGARTPPEPTPEEALAAAIADKDYWDPPDAGAADARDSRVAKFAGLAGASRRAMAPAQYNKRENVIGGGLRRLTVGELAPVARRDDPHYHAPRYVPIGFAEYRSPVINPIDYVYYRLAGWRVATPRDLPEPETRALLWRITRLGPGPAGYVRLGDTLVPAALGPGDRQALAQTESRYGNFERKYANI